MTLLRLLNPQGIAGLALSLGLALLLLLQKGETRHWKSESGRYEQLYGAGQQAFATTVANYRAAADQARAADQAAAARIRAQQSAISERTIDDYQARLAAARARADRLRVQAAPAAADRGRAGAAPVPGLSAAARGADQAASKDRLPPADALTATEQAIQLDALIQWVKAQAAVDNNGAAVTSPSDN